THNSKLFLAVDRRGVEPRSPGCKPGVVPSWTSSPSFVLGPSALVLRAWVLGLREKQRPKRDDQCTKTNSSRGGSRTHNRSPGSRPGRFAKVCVLGRSSVQGSGVRNQESGLRSQKPARLADCRPPTSDL